MRGCRFTVAVTLMSVALGGAIEGAVAQQAGDLSWSSYIDERTGTRVDFPSNLFSVNAGETERGVGRAFESADGRAKFAAFSLENQHGDTPQSFVRKFLTVDPSGVDYRRVTGRFFAVSGVRDGEVFYSRCNFGGRIHCISMSYPASEVRAWDGIVTRISLSLRGPRA